MSSVYIKRVLEIYPAVIATLEHFYAVSNDLSATAGGLLMTFRKQSTIFVLALAVLDERLRALARLSKMLQTASDDLSTAVVWFSSLLLAVTVTKTTSAHRGV